MFCEHKSREHTTLISSYELYLLALQEVADVTILKQMLRPSDEVYRFVPPQLRLIPDLHPAHVLLDADEDGGLCERPSGGRGHLVRVPGPRNVTENQTVKMGARQLAIRVCELGLLLRKRS